MKLFSYYVETARVDELDFELEVAVVLNRKGRNIRAADADRYMAGMSPNG